MFSYTSLSERCQAFVHIPICWNGRINWTTIHQIAYQASATCCLDKQGPHLAKRMMRNMHLLAIAIRIARRRGDEPVRLLHVLRLITRVYIGSFCARNDSVWYRFARRAPFHIGIDGLDDESIPSLFRYRNKEQLHRILTAFHFPNWIMDSQETKFTGEEVLLLGLYRLHAPNNYSDPAYRHLIGYVNDQIPSSGFRVFLPPWSLIGATSSRIICSIDFPKCHRCRIRFERSLATWAVRLLKTRTSEFSDSLTTQWMPLVDQAGDQHGMELTLRAMIPWFNGRGTIDGRRFMAWNGRHATCQTAWTPTCGAPCHFVITTFILWFYLKLMTGYTSCNRTAQSSIFYMETQHTQLIIWGLLLFALLYVVYSDLLCEYSQVYCCTPQDWCIDTPSAVREQMPIQLSGVFRVGLWQYWNYVGVRWLFEVFATAQNACRSYVFNMHDFTQCTCLLEWQPDSSIF